MNQQQLYTTLDSLYAILAQNDQTRAQRGDLSLLDALNIEAKKNQTTLKLASLRTETDNVYAELRVMINTESDFTIDPLKAPHQITDTIPGSLSVFDLLNFERTYFKSLVSVEKNKMAPDISLNYFLGSNSYENGKFYHGFQVGLAIPMFFKADRARVKAARISENSFNYFADN